ncbi:MAG: hypothetical protein ACO1OQ_10080, partial [Rufibacter sp.]
MARKIEREQKLSAQPEVLIVRGAQVPVEVRAQLPEKLLRNEYRYAIRVYYRADKGIDEQIGS